MKGFSVTFLKHGQGIVRLAREPSGFSAGFLQANYRRISRFFCRNIFAGALAQYLGGLCYIEDIVDDLESEIKSLSKPGDGGKFPGVCVRAHCAEPDRGFQHCRSLVLVDES